MEKTKLLFKFIFDEILIHFLTPIKNNVFNVNKSNFLLDAENQ